ncbi:hypothetical protein B0A49_03108 [Cryomyces minteri]|uniref:Iron-sulfur assembly protein 1 n=1 Tax=Cryomyces minteri TaxID=331657 RepID=A0A4U0WPB3_9PEZI|nr:hypothetical protein B0A49_05919 [Cryomyces minteri]TKA69287.1 hypothetical protein B0A49_03108 [Cryomyces minteri]
MSFSRAVSASAGALFKVASSANPSTAQRCPQCFRAFASYIPLKLSSRRQMQTATALRPESLDNQMPPPRNTGVPDTSIAGGVPEINSRRPPRLTETRESSPASAQDQCSSVSIPEGEAQKSKPANPMMAVSAATINQKPATEKPKRSKLRPRKAAMTLSSAAVSHLRALLDQPEPNLIRVGVKNRGCSGLAYNLEYVEKPGTFDEAVEQDGVKVLIDSKALFSIIGSEMDWIEDKLNQRFVFRNPNITEQCGCGESFSTS